MLRQVLAEERERADQHMAAATLWQERARVLEGRLLALGAGDETRQDAPGTQPEAPGATEAPRPADGAPWWRRWLRRIAKGG